jgi:hypothetical protein
MYGTGNSRILYRRQPQAGARAGGRRAGAAGTRCAGLTRKRLQAAPQLAAFPAKPAIFFANLEETLATHTETSSDRAAR